MVKTKVNNPIVISTARSGVIYWARRFFGSNANDIRTGTETLIGAERGVGHDGCQAKFGRLSGTWTVNLQLTSGRVRRLNVLCHWRAVSRVSRVPESTLPMR
jgi:hypothetical protein